MAHMQRINEIRARYVSSNITPVWLLPYWRLFRGQAQGDYALAFRMLPHCLPAGCRSPSLVECAVILAHHDLA